MGAGGNWEKIAVPVCCGWLWLWFGEQEWRREMEKATDLWSIDPSLCGKGEEIKPGLVLVTSRGHSARRW